MIEGLLRRGFLHRGNSRALLRAAAGLLDAGIPLKPGVVETADSWPSTDCRRVGRRRPSAGRPSAISATRACSTLLRAVTRDARRTPQAASDLYLRRPAASASRPNAACLRGFQHRPEAAHAAGAPGAFMVPDCLQPLPETRARCGARAADLPRSAKALRQTPLELLDPRPDLDLPAQALRCC